MQTQSKMWANTKSLILTALFVSLGLLIPYVAGHAAGIPGTVLLPMHIPVLACGLLLGWRYGALCGLATPVLSALVTGMPPLWPVLPMMACELVVYGALTGLLRRKYRWPLYAALVVAMLAGRVASGLVMAVIIAPPSAMALVQSVAATAATGLPGILIQLAVVPAFVKLLERALRMSLAPKAAPANPALAGALAEAVQEIQGGQYSCIVLQNNKIVHRADGRGVKPLRELYESEAGRELMRGAIVADRIIGKAAAMILVLGGVGAVHGEVMSASAKAYLTQRGISCSYGRCVDMISNRTGNGICPIEQSVLDTDDAQEGYARLSQTIETLMRQAAAQ